jgi:hypothetical protein
MVPGFPLIRSGIADDGDNALPKPSSGGPALAAPAGQNVNVVRNENTAATPVVGARAGLK